MEVAEEARSTLTGYVGRAAKDWLTASGIAAKRGDHKPAKEILLHAGAIERLGDTSGSRVVVVVGMPGHPAMIPPSQEAINAEMAKQEALTARQAGAIDVVAQASVAGAPQPPVARLEAPSAKPDTPND